MYINIITNLNNTIVNLNKSSLLQDDTLFHFNNINNLIETIEDHKAISKTYILALDDDKAGQRGNDKLKDKFK